MLLYKTKKNVFKSRLSGCLKIKLKNPFFFFLSIFAKGNLCKKRKKQGPKDINPVLLHTSVDPQGWRTGMVTWSQGRNN